MTTKHRQFHIDLMEPATAQAVVAALRQAGIEAWESREVSPNHDGVIITELLAKGIWEQETGQSLCPGKDCPGDVMGNPHRRYEDLSEEQREIFTRSVAAFMERSRLHDYAPSLSLNQNDFQGIALGHCRQENTE